MHRIITGENWPYIMTDAMIRERCVLLKYSTMAPLGPNGTDVLLLGGTYFDPVDDSATLDALPRDLKVRCGWQTTARLVERSLARMQTVSVGQVAAYRAL